MFLAWFITIFVVLMLKQVGFLGLTSLLEFIDLSKSHLDGQLGVSLLTVLRRRVSRCDCLEEEGLSLLFSSILKRLQYNVSQHVGDTSTMIQQCGLCTCG